LNTVPFSFDGDLTKVIHGPAEAPKVAPPGQTADGEEYLCGNSGPAFPGNNPGRDQDRNRQCECTPATPFARYIS
jgi:hypothetical protein